MGGTSEIATGERETGGGATSESKPGDRKGGGGLISESEPGEREGWEVTCNTIQYNFIRFLAGFSLGVTTFSLAPGNTEHTLILVFATSIATLFCIIPLAKPNDLDYATTEH